VCGTDASIAFENLRNVVVGYPFTYPFNGTNVLFDADPTVYQVCVCVDKYVSDFEIFVYLHSFFVELIQSSTHTHTTLCLVTDQLDDQPPSTMAGVQLGASTLYRLPG
jgi:hypothetical protein